MATFFSQQEYQKLSNLYKLGFIQNIFYFKKGLQTSRVVIKTPKGKFVLSKYSLSSKKDIISKSRVSLQYEVDFLSTLKHLPVPHYFISSKGRFIEKYKNFWITVYKFLPGNEPKIFTPVKAYELGKFLGTFHKKGKRFKHQLSGRRKFYDLTPAVIKKMSPCVYKQNNHYIKSVINEIKQGVKNNQFSAQLPKGPIHVDIKPENILFINNKLTGVIDFGNFYIGVYMIDIGKTIMWNCCKRGKIEKELFEKFIKGYERCRKLTLTEHSYLRTSILFAIFSHIWVDLYHIPLKYVPEEYTVSLVKKFLPIARWLQKNSLNL